MFMDKKGRELLCLGFVFLLLMAPVQAHDEQTNNVPAPDAARETARTKRSRNLFRSELVEIVDEFEVIGNERFVFLVGENHIGVKTQVQVQRALLGIRVGPD